MPMEGYRSESAGRPEEPEPPRDGRILPPWEVGSVDGGWLLEEDLPQEIADRLDDYSASVKKLMVETFGQPEIPPEVLADMDDILKLVADDVRQKRYIEEIDEKLTSQLRELAVKASSFAGSPNFVEVTVVPGESYQVVYVNGQGETVERAMSEDEMSLLFDLEMWAEEYGQLKNMESFRAVLEASRSAVDESEGNSAVKIERKVFESYAKFGFTREQVSNLIVLADEGRQPSEMVPDAIGIGKRKAEIMRQVWDEYLSSANKSTYIKLAAGIVVLGAAEGIAPMLIKEMMDSDTVNTAALCGAGYLSASVGIGYLKRLMSLNFDQFVNEVMEQPGGLNEQIAFDLSFRPGELMTQADSRGQVLTALQRGQDAFRDILTSTAKFTAPAVAMAATGLGMMMISDWRLGLVSLASMPIMVAIGRRADRAGLPILEKTYDNESQTVQEVEDQISAHMETVLSGARDRSGRHLEGLLQRKNLLALEQSRVRTATNMMLQDFMSPAVFAALTVAGAAMKASGAGEAGGVIAAIIYSSMFRNAFSGIVEQQNSLIESCVEITELEETFNGYAKEETRADADRISAGELPDLSIDFRDVTLDLDGQRIIDGASFSVPAGSVTQLVGLSGSGKTTLMKIMAGYYRASSGEARIGGVPVGDVKKTGPESIYTRLAYQGQTPYVFESGTLRDNLTFGNPDADEEMMAQVVRELRLKRFITRKGVNFDGSAVGVSGGERIRLALARTIIKIRSLKNGGIVFLDEPTVGLDETNWREVARVLKEEKACSPNITYVVVSHEPAFVQALSEGQDGQPALKVRTVNIEDGKVRGLDKPSD